MTPVLSTVIPEIGEEVDVTDDQGVTPVEDGPFDAARAVRLPSYPYPYKPINLHYFKRCRGICGPHGCHCTRPVRVCPCRGIGRVCSCR